jgi:Lrp/AsnC family leucine-responsive transcriptional regulator
MQDETPTFTGGAFGVDRDMDRFDWAILDAMEEDARQSYGAIANKVGLSKTPCWTRVQTLEQNGTIKGYRAVLDSSSLGLKLTAYVQVMIEFGRYEEFEDAVDRHPSIIECYTTAGAGDYLLHVVTSDVEQLDTLLREELSLLPGVQRFSTTICLKRIKEPSSLTEAARKISSTPLRHR